MSDFEDVVSFASKEFILDKKIRVADFISTEFSFSGKSQGIVFYIGRRIWKYQYDESGEIYISAGSVSFLYPAASFYLTFCSDESLEPSVIFSVSERGVRFYLSLYSSDLFRSFFDSFISSPFYRDKLYLKCECFAS